MAFLQNYVDLNGYYASSSGEGSFSPTDLSPLVIDIPDYENMKHDIIESINEPSSCMYQPNHYDFDSHQAPPMMCPPVSPPFLGFSNDEISKCMESCSKFGLMRPENQERIKIERKRERNRIAAAKCRRKKLEKISYEESRIAKFNEELSLLSLTRSKLEKEVHDQKVEALDHFRSGCHLPRTKKLLTTLQYCMKCENTPLSYNLHEL